MSRPTDWSPLCNGDPIPGDPDAVQRAANDYDKTYQAIGEARRRLDRLSMGENKSKGLDAILEQVKSVREQLSSVESRVQGASTALSGYARALRGTQEDSLPPLRMAQQAEMAKKRAQYARDVARADYFRNITNGSARDAARDAYNLQNGKVGEADTDLRTARHLLALVIEQRDKAAEGAIKHLKNVDACSPVKDSWWDKVVDFCDEVYKILEGLDEIMSWFSLIGGIVGAVLSVICPPLGGLILLTVGAIGLLHSGLKLITNIVRTTGGRGNGWGEVFGDAVGFGLSLAFFIPALSGAKGLISGIAKAGIKASIKTGLKKGAKKATETVTKNVTKLAAKVGIKHVSKEFLKKASVPTMVALKGALSYGKWELKRQSVSFVKAQSVETLVAMGYAPQLLALRTTGEVIKRGVMLSEQLFRVQYCGNARRK